MKKNNPNIPSGYKPSPLGIIPEDWEVKSIKDVSTIKGRIGYRGYTTDDIVNDGDGAISLSPSNIVDGKLQFNSVTRITWEKYYESPEIMLCNGDIVMVKTGSSFGKVAFVDNLPQEATINPQFVIINNIKCDNKWLCYLFDSDCIQKNVHKIVVGGAIPTMSQEEIANFRIAVPPLPEQQRIVSVLSLWDTAIAKQTALIEQLTLRKRGLMQQLLTGKKRLKGFEGEWKEVRVGDIAQITMGQSPDSRFYNERGEGLPLIQGNADIKDRKSIQRIWTSSVTKACECNDIIMSVRAPVGEIAIATQKSCIGRGVCSITSTNVDAEYLFQLLLLLEDSWGNIEQGGTFTSINSQEIQKKKVFIPKQSEQIAIATILTLADKEIEIQKQKLAALQEQKKGLMQVLLTGKRRI